MHQGDPRGSWRVGRKADCGGEQSESELLSSKNILITLSQTEHFRARKRRSCNSLGTEVALPLFSEAVPVPWYLYVTLAPTDLPGGLGPQASTPAEPHIPTCAFGHRAFGEI